jgi:hypothetical protein
MNDNNNDTDYGTKYNVSINGNVTVCKSVPEVINMWIPDYPLSTFDATDEEQDKAYELRCKYSYVQAEHIQKEVMKYILDRDGATEKSIVKPVLDILTTPKWKTPDLSDLQNFWGFEIPLVLVRSLYAPHDEAIAPKGNIVWIDPVDELGYIDSLNEAHLIDIVDDDGNKIDLDFFDTEAGWELYTLREPIF